jgi:23S rRNA (guanosine2251-2'-O)-methyltransferase
MESQVEGRNPVLELLKSDHPVNRVLIAKDIGRSEVISEITKLIKSKGIPFDWSERKNLDRKSATGRHQGIIAFTAPHEYFDVEDLLDYAKKKNEKPLIVILDGIEDPHNLGAIIRTAECAGAHGVVIPKRRAAQLNETVAKTSAGAISHLKVARVTNISDTIKKLKDDGVWVVGVEAGQEKSIYEVDMRLPTAIVIGSEGRGIARLVKERCEVLASIPLKGKISSLNASAAASVVLYEAVRQRKS